MFNDDIFAKSNALKVRDEHFSHLGTSSSSIMDFIENILIHKKITAKSIN
jgi:hypothetical protein